MDARVRRWLTTGEWMDMDEYGRTEVGKATQNDVRLAVLAFLGTCDEVLSVVHEPQAITVYYREERK